MSEPVAKVGSLTVIPLSTRYEAGGFTCTVDIADGARRATFRNPVTGSSISMPVDKIKDFTDFVQMVYLEV